ncbi:IS701 family transposase [Micromonospora sp. PPF5-17]|uniref:IS701 family transposase n=1 Tax=Micromonospora solifontis TaxID=2487138 RepID=A0ABX9WAJ0_9ACTN|nr:IS701 family transposase [Micromonospora sp. PPF5-17B]NES39771.1 IS701 family transposase [Micromonospora solifontis]NES59168.1 IS701 family transposase [Micromonospora sp. PPF5-6]RNL85903.1 IS701 family transposase [Micromonospora solifontis]
MDRWHAELDRLHARVGVRFRRSEPRRRARQYLCGLVSGLGRKNGWTLAEQAGEVSPDGMQRLLRWADWDVDAVRDDVRDYVVEYLGDPAGVLIVDDTGFLKKGVRSAGVQRQYSGTAGRTENCQVGVFLAYRSAKGHALIDRQLYLPASWTDDRDRCRAAGIPDEVGFATKVQMARTMLARALEAGVPVGWVTMDEAYGQSKSLRVWLEHRDVAYVVATRRNDDMITTAMGTARADQLVAALPARAWCRLSAGAGAHGPREYWRARVPVRICWRPGRGHWLLARRSITTGEIAYYVCYGPRRTRLIDLARVAGARWAIEECFQQAKNEAGLDEYQVRDWRAWYAHITLAMAAHAWLSAARSLAAKGEPAPTTA